ncbi:choice-of-anchor M domain-containing protein [Saccharothrix sp. NRRL B-16348]|uniref:choice-of-anchor M domain-containing protein n=1 Tax=Saccharothrix sp. NRRL B-16348 TaxID=1415542 RepID=UPI0006ADBD0F|nr:choice-of-anchor M domain-containing protein [Saccharothrix sp. NRRL B-16348]
MRTSARLALLPLAVAALLGAVVAPATASSTAVVLDSGHVDVIGIAFEDGKLDIHVHDETNDVEYAPSDVKIVAKSAARTTVPADPAYSFLGTAGSPVWVLPEVEDPALLWPGIGTEEVEPGVFVDDALSLRFEWVYGPAGFSVFTTDAFGAPTVLVDSGNGLPDTVAVTAANHQHASWAFEAAGAYAVVVRVSGVLAATGQKVTSAPALYRFKVNA